MVKDEAQGGDQGEVSAIVVKGIITRLINLRRK